MNNTNKIDMKKNTYLSKNINFLTPRPPKYNINLVKKRKIFRFSIILFLQLKTICIMEIEIKNNVNKKFHNYESKNSKFLTP